MRTIIRGQRGGIEILVGFLIVVAAVAFAIYEFWGKERAGQLSSTQSQPKNVIDGARDKVNDAMEKQMSRIPVEEPTQPPGQQDK